MEYDDSINEDNMTIPEFHTFKEVAEHLAKGGAAYRWGTNYPIYCKGHWYELETRYDGGSSGECSKQGAVFSVDEQNSTNWVLISKEDWEAREQRMRDAWKKIMEERAEREKDRKVYKETMEKVTKKSFWDWWW